MQNRKAIYLKWINGGLKQLELLQDLKKDSHSYGSFFTSFIQGDARYNNARWQESVLSLAYAYKYLHKQEYKTRIIAGIDYWCKIQHKDGSFEEYTKGERSFSATAFSLYALVEAADIIGFEDRWNQHLKKAAAWLLKNDELILINQEAAASLALLKMYKLYNSRLYLEGAENKLSLVLKRQIASGDFSEKGGEDKGYSSLTVEILSRYYSLKKDKGILKAITHYFKGCMAQNPKNSRNTSWVIVGGFEYFSHINKHAELALGWLLKNKNVIHLPDDRHLCTDLYRLFWALLNINANINNKKIIAIKDKPAMIPGNMHPLLRRIGMHKVRRWLNWIKSLCP